MAACLQIKTLELVPWSDAEQEEDASYSTVVTMMRSKDKSTGLNPFTEVDAKFEASVKGLSDARTAIRRQKARIVNMADAIEKDLNLATVEDHTEPYQAPTAFEARILVVEVPEKLRVKSRLLSGKRIAAKELTKDEQRNKSRKKIKPCWARNCTPARNN
jgi:hypothetical protein